MNPNITNNSDNLTEDKLDKKAYKKPELVLYGNITEITHTVDNSGMDDGGMGMTDKT
ncbi:MAG: hypothetical protein ACRD82_11915 [Blastocatellia bacterium]